MIAATTTTETQTQEKTKTVVVDPNAMPPQTEGPALKFVPGVAKLFEELSLIDPKLELGMRVVKCVGPKGTRWVELDQYYLHTNRLVQARFVERITLVNVSLESTTVRHGGGCGVAPTNSLIGYAKGQKLTSGHVNPKAQTFIPKYDRNTGRFMIDGLEVIGAKAMILGDNCIALLVEPIFKERTTT